MSLPHRCVRAVLSLSESTWPDPSVELLFGEWPPLVHSVRGKLIIAVGAVVVAHAPTHGELHNGATRLADVFVGMCPGRINACRSGMGFTGAIADSG